MTVVALMRGKLTWLRSQPASRWQPARSSAVDTIGRDHSGVVKLPAVVGCVEKVTVSEVSVAAVTVPTEAPSLKTTVLFAATGSNPEPAIVMVVAFAGKLASCRR